MGRNMAIGALYDKSDQRGGGTLWEETEEVNDAKENNNNEKPNHQEEEEDGLNIFICHKQNKRIGHKLYNLGCRLRYLHDIHTLTYTDINYI